MISFSDNLDVVDDSPLVVLATIQLLTTEEGGRHKPVLGTYSYRPNHNFGSENNRHFHIGVVGFDKDDVIYPGDKRDVLVQFLNVKGLREMLSVGLEWRIQEGASLVMVGKVIEMRT